MIAFAGLAWTAAKGFFGGLSAELRKALLIGAAVVVWTLAVWQTSKNAERDRNNVAGLRNTIAILQRDAAIGRAAVDDADMREAMLERQAASRQARIAALEKDLDDEDRKKPPRPAACGPAGDRASPADVKRLLQFGR